MNIDKYNNINNTINNSYNYTNFIISSYLKKIIKEKQYVF
jgi:hypothetical protein